MENHLSWLLIDFFLLNNALKYRTPLTPLLERHIDTLQELNNRAQGEVTIREALRELDLWGAGTTFALTEYEDNNKHKIMLIKDWKDLVNAVSHLLLLYLKLFKGYAVEMLKEQHNSSSRWNKYTSKLYKPDIYFKTKSLPHLGWR